MTTEQINESHYFKNIASSGTLFVWRRTPQEIQKGVDASPYPSVVSHERSVGFGFFGMEELVTNLLGNATTDEHP
jgi:hypothetical protein